MGVALTLSSGVSAAAAKTTPRFGAQTTQLPSSGLPMPAAITQEIETLSANRGSTGLMAVRAIVDGAPNAAQYSDRERDRIARKLYAFGRELVEFVDAHPDLYVGSVPPGAERVSPSFTVGVGRFIYLHHVTPTDQRWMLQVGTGLLAAAICAVSAGSACSVAMAVAAVAIPTVSEYYSASYCLEMQFWYWGALHKAYRTRC